MVLTDAPIVPGIRVKAYSHLLCESGVTFFGSAKLARAWGRDFPRSLDGAPFLLPTDNTALRQELNRWFEAHAVQPQIVGEFEDDALLTEFGRAGLGILPSLSRFGSSNRPPNLYRIGRTDETLGRIYAISIERKLKHPAVVAICKTARDSPPALRRHERL